MILILSGTQDGRMLCEKLKREGVDIIVSTATEYGASLVDSSETVTVVNGRMTVEDMVSFIEKHTITMLIDATHPYAKDVSLNAISACKNKGIDYFRYERPSSIIKGLNMYKSYSKIVEALKKRQGNILLTIGSNNLEQFKDLIPSGRIYARVLPMLRVMEKCDQLGLKAKNIIAMQGPFSHAMNEAMYDQYDISYMVTKETSDVGGFIEKVETAIEKNIEVFVLERPEVPYENVFDSLDALIDAVKSKS